MFLNMVKSFLLKLLAIFYFLAFIIGMLGHFGLHDFSVGIYSVFNNILGKYTIVLPLVCLLFALICWLLSRSYARSKKKEPPGVELEKESPESGRKHYGRSRSAGANGFPAYFKEELEVISGRPVKDNLNNLGTNFSTYFGQGRKNIYLPSKSVDLNGFKEYFKNSEKMAVNPPVEFHGREKGRKRQTVPSARMQTKEYYREKQPDSSPYTAFSPEGNTGGWILPSLELLKTGSARPSQPEQHNPQVIENVLNNFGVSAKVINICSGPVITRYELSPTPGTKISKIVNLADDISLALASKDIRIEAPIPGKAAIGIEVPRRSPTIVYFREVVGSNEFSRNKSVLKIALGKDITGKPVVGQLDKMPHLLVAGATGSGKSIFINSLIASLLYNSPDDLRLLLIDPKMVELTRFNGIPHLLAPVVTDPKKAAGYLKYIAGEMERRYELFAARGVRDIDHYNRETGDAPLPYYVVIIDELADLMMVSSREIEEVICRLAQMARAAGIHLVIATQRPSVNVLTGLIKANIPSRISFAVSSQVDSRTILDTAGAEKLLGNGDMLYLPLGMAKPQRVHGCLIFEEEVRNLVRHWQEQDEPVYELSEEDLEDQDSEHNWEDDRFAEAGKLVITSGIASVSFLQRRMRIGYSRAARLMDMLEEAGIVGKSEGNKPRSVLVSLEAFNRKYS